MWRKKGGFGKCWTPIKGGLWMVWQFIYGEFICATHTCVDSAKVCVIKCKEGGGMRKCSEGHMG